MSDKAKISMETVLKKIVIWGSFLAVLIPLVIVPKSYFPYIIQKTLFFRIIIEFVVAAYLTLAVLNKEYRPKKSWILWSFLVFMLVMLITTFTSQSFSRSWWGNWERMFGTFFYLHFFAWFVALIGVFKKKKDWNHLLNLSLLSSLVICLYSISQRFGLSFTFQSGLERVNGTIGNASFLASYLLLHLFIALLFLVTKTGWKWKSYYLFVLVAELFVLLLTGTRGATVALFASFPAFIILAFWLKAYRQKTVKYLIAASVAILILGGGLLAVKNTAVVQNNYWLKRLTAFSLSDNTVQTRLSTWQWGLKGFRDNFFLGVGPENYQLVFNKYFEPEFYDYTGDEIWFDRAHNILVDIASTMGIFGLLSYLAVFGAVFYSLNKLKNKGVLNFANFTVIFLLFSTYFIQNIFVFDSLNSLIVFMIILGYLHFIYLKASPVKENKSVDVKLNFGRATIIGAISLAGFVYLLFGVNLPEIKANNYVYQTYPDKVYNRYESMVENYKAAYRVGINKIDPAILLSSSLGETISLSGNGISLDQKINDLELAISWMNRAISLDSENIFLHYLQAKNYGLAAELTGAKEYIEKGFQEANIAHKLSPGRIRPLWILAQLYLFNNEVEKAMDYLNQAIQLNPREAESYYFLSIIYKNQGEMDKFYEQYDLLIKYEYPFYNKSQIVEAIPHYDELDDVKSLIYLFEALVRVDSKDPNNWQNLTDLYVKDAQYEQAISALKRATYAIPAFSSRAWAQLQEIKELINQQNNEKDNSTQ
jgi:O-antigen ligase